MSSENVKEKQRIVEEYRRSGQPWPATARQITDWALANKRYDLRTPTVRNIIAREFAQAMREKYHVDRKGRRVRSMHPARVERDGEQLMLWDDMRTATRIHMQMAFTNRRNHIVGECRQVKTDVDSYNDSHPKEEPIQMVLDFTEDVEEYEGLAEYTEDQELEAV